MTLTYALLLASPWLIRVVLESRVAPRTLVWSYLTCLVAAALATVVLLAALFLHYLPHDYLTKAGLACAHTLSACATLLPIWANAAFSLLVGGVLLGLTLFFVFAVASQLSSTGKRRDSLVASGHSWPRALGRFRNRALLVDDPAPLSYVIGFARPRVVVSDGLLEALDEDEIEAVLAHEEGHVRGFDNLILLVARTVSMTFALLPGTGLAFRRLRRAQELAADDWARRRTGDPLVVASSLQKFARTLLRPGSTPSLAVAFADEGNVTERIRGLVFGEAVRTSKRWLAASLLCVALVFAAFTGSAFAFTGVTLASSAKSAACCHPAAQTQAAHVLHEDCRKGK